MNKSQPHEVDSKSKREFAPEDEASYYLGDNFEMGGVTFGPEEKEQKININNQDVYQTIVQAISSNQIVNDSDIDIKFEDGFVYLRGMVENRQIKKEAERAVEMVNGVRDVMNLLRISPEEKSL